MVKTLTVTDDVYEALSELKEKMGAAFDIPLCILEVEDVRKKELFDFHQDLLNWLSIEDPIVLVILWITDSEEKKQEYMKIIKEYFTNLGAKEVLFLEENDPKLDEKFSKANIVYLPGGDIQILFRKLNGNPKVVEKLRKFPRVIIGNSTGAIVLSKEGYGHKERELTKYKGLGIVNLKILVHVVPDDLKKLKDKDVILLDEGDYIVCVRSYQ